ncbi:hypothetical protein [Nostoc sp.]|uniref:hypothetical protein n=1 Tax=Nostoc sp. TaxID=1180 RepID=UPI002FF3E798
MIKQSSIGKLSSFQGANEGVSSLFWAVITLVTQSLDFAVPAWGVNPQRQALRLIQLIKSFIPVL